MSDYNIHTNVRYQPLELIDIPKMIDDNEPWFNQTLSKVNDSVVRLGIIKGEFHWHHSSPGVTRGICSSCGSSITYENEKRPGEIDIAVNCLDDPGAPLPRAHIWTEDKQPWHRIGDDLPVYEKNIG